MRRYAIFVLAALGVVALAGCALAKPGGSTATQPIFTTEPWTPPEYTTAPDYTTAPELPAEPESPPEKVVYKKLSQSTFAKIMKHSEDYAGQHFVIYGLVAGVDDSGDFTFAGAYIGPARAKRQDVPMSDGTANRYVSFSYPERSLLQEGKAELWTPYSRSEFRAQVTVAGSASMANMFDGEVLPIFEVDSYTVYNN
jgi:hypothetical protein